MSTREQFYRSTILAGALLVLVGCGHFPRFPGKMKNEEPAGLASGQAAEIQIALGRSLEADGDHVKAMAAYREAARNAPKLAEPRLRMAILLDRSGRFAEAAGYYEEALRASPGDPRIFCDRGYSLSLQGKDAEAELALRQAIAIDPRFRRAHNNLAAILGRSGRSEEALAEFRASGVPEADAHLNLAFSLGQGRHWTEARKHVEIARAKPTSDRNFSDDIARLDALIARAESSKLPNAGSSDSAVMTAGGTTTPTPLTLQRQ